MTQIRITMAKDSNVLHDADLIQVIDETDDLVQVLGVVPSEDDGEIPVQSVELEDGSSVFIDVDEEGIETDSLDYVDIQENHNDDLLDSDNAIEG